VTPRAGERAGANVLYITYDGLTDPLGRSQILPYLSGLAAIGHRITILSCEKPIRLQQDGERLRRHCADLGLAWHPLKYHKKPPILSSAFDAAALQRAAIKLHGEQPFDIVHCRSYIAAHAGLALKRRFGVRFLFDMRGFWPDEKVEGGNWNLANPLFAAVYRYFKRLESRLLRGADQIVSLTEAGKRQLQTRPELAGRTVPVTVIPCCVDFDHFPLATPALRREARKQMGIPADAPVLAYLGSLGSWYMLDEMLAFFAVFASRQRMARFLFVTLEDPQPIMQAGTDHGVDPKALIIHPASRDDVPRLMAAADLGIFFIRPVFSKIASSPTKMGEMLATGLPIVANSGVGDVEQMIEEMDCGVAVREFTPEAYAHALDELDMTKGIAKARRDRARPRFDVSLGIERYHRMYNDTLA
jgi:glycosyltransferase involved in cell wall biosynthesis